MADPKSARATPTAPWSSGNALVDRFYIQACSALPVIRRPGGLNMTA